MYVLTLEQLLETKALEETQQFEVQLLASQCLKQPLETETLEVELLASLCLVEVSASFLILNDNPVHEDLNERILKLITQSDQDQDDEGLPTEIKPLIIVSCSSSKSLGTEGTLKSLNSLKDLHIEDFPLLLSSLQHLRIQDCPSGTENEQGPECTKISHIPDRETDFIRSQHLTKKKAHSAAWYLPFLCSGG
ncbi:hypothetical protein Dsin_023993 [Dipteronia sinensis]|uniref:Uncharacterized protein n=1 Tax=Dipteronia sinensis TaxID=43782 RepID=A0AAE0A4E2_9ROSI|nr:hypothetical protein Dsin_023993 [Dipteronia sinensis]